MNPTLPSKLAWTAEIDGDDLVIRNVHVTCFGGKYDSGDDGRTESGIANDGRYPTLCQIALPIRSTEAATAGSPLAFTGPHIPWGTAVKVWREIAGEQTAVQAILTDNGPDEAQVPTHAMDFNPPLSLHFAPGFDPEKIANEWSGDGFCARIIGGAKWAIPA